MNAFYKMLAVAMIAAGAFTSCETPVIEPDDTEQTPGGNPDDNIGENPETPGENPGEDLDPNIPAGEEGEMTFEIETPDQVTVDGPLDMTIVQTSSYTDPDGTVYECSPKATVSVAALKDTVFVTDIRQLTAVGESAAPQTSEEGDSPVTHTINQAFEVGGQTVEFDLAYEVYTYVNSKKQNVEMPYVKLNPADLGSADAADTKGSSAVKLSDITVRPLSSATRSITVTDSTAYEVTVRFNLEAETANLAETSKQSIPFEVVYVGVVTQTSTYPGAEYSYELKDGEGNALTGTEFTVEPGATFQLHLSQHSSYTDQNGAVTATPEAWTKIKSPETIAINNVDELADHVGDILIETRYDELEGNMPYYTLGEVTFLGDVKTEEVSRSEDGKTQLYKATATCTQKAYPVNIEDGKQLEFTYTVSYLGEISARLINVEYKQEVIWEEAHDNIYTNSQIVVTRTATYSDGSIDETKFYSTKNFIQGVTSRDKKDNTGEIEYTTYERIKDGDKTIATCATGVPDLEHFVYEGADEEDLYIELPDYEGPVGVWSEYKHQDTKELYNEGVRTEGFYGKQFGYRSAIVGLYRGDKRYNLRQYKIDLIYKDRFCCIDGKLFTCEPLEHTHRWSVETIETPNRGTCALHKLEADVTWLGRDFYFAVVDTVYVKQPAAAPAARTQRSSTARSTASVQASDEASMTFSVETVPGSEPYTEQTRIRPDGTRTTCRYDGIVTEFER